MGGGGPGGPLPVGGGAVVGAAAVALGAGASGSAAAGAAVGGASAEGTVGLGRWVTAGPEGRQQISPPSMPMRTSRRSSKRCASLSRVSWCTHSPASCHSALMPACGVAHSTPRTLIYARRPLRRGMPSVAALGAAAIAATVFIWYSKSPLLLSCQRSNAFESNSGEQVGGLCSILRSPCLGQHAPRHRLVPRFLGVHAGVRAVARHHSRRVLHPRARGRQLVLSSFSKSYFLQSQCCLLLSAPFVAYGTLWC